MATPLEEALTLLQNARPDEVRITLLPDGKIQIEIPASADGYGSRTLDRHIEITPGIAGGKPRIAGHRITVQNIVIWHEQMGRSVEEICSDYGLTLAEVYAALAYYFDHQMEIDQSIEKQEDFVKKLRKSTPSVLEQKLKAFRDG